MKTFQALVSERLANVRFTHHELRSAHEAYAVLMEEVCEFWDQVRLKSHERDRLEMLRELVDIALVAQRAAEDLKLVPIVIGVLPDGSMVKTT